MKKVAAAVVAFGAFAAALLWRRPPSPGIDASDVQDLGTGTPAAPSDPVRSGYIQDLTTWADGWTQTAIEGIAPQQLPTQSADQQLRNVQATLAMIRKAEGTAKDGGWGALFGWPMSGRSFDPYSVNDHPKQFFTYVDKAGKSNRTSAAGGFQITWTTWSDERLKFLAWATLNGYSTSGFTPATQEAFAIYLMWKDKALPHVKAGRLAQSMPILARRWASLPGYSQDNNPERSIEFVANSYLAAGGQLA